MPGRNERRIAATRSASRSKALGHGSKAVHRAYARNAKVMLPPLEAFEAQATGRNIVTFPGTTKTTAQETAPAAELIAQR